MTSTRNVAGAIAIAASLALLLPASSAGAAAAASASTTSTKYAGWQFAVQNATRLVVEFTIPQITCSKSLTGILPGAFMITGTGSKAEFSGAGVTITCHDGKLGLHPSAIIGTKDIQGTEAMYAGDLVKARVLRASGTITVRVLDLTSGHRFSFTRSGAAAAAVAELVMDDTLYLKGVQLPVVDFGTIRFVQGAIDGQAIGAMKPRQRVNMTTKAGTVRVSTSGLSGDPVNSFSTVWKHA